MDLLDLAGRAARGDRAAGHHLVQATYADAWRFAQSLVGSQRAPDVVQDTYLRAWRSLADRPPTGDVKGWLLAIVWRASVDELRRDYRWQRNKDRLAAQPAPARTDDPEDGLVQWLLSQLDPDRRAAFALTQLLGFSYAEAAEICDTEVGTIRSRVARARSDLAGILSHRSETRRSGRSP